MREEASFHMFFEKDDSKLPIRRKVPSHCEDGQTPLELVSKAEEYCLQFCMKQLIWLSTVFTIDFSRKTTLKLFRQ